MSAILYPKDILAVQDMLSEHGRTLHLIETVSHGKGDEADTFALLSVRGEPMLNLTVAEVRLVLHERRRIIEAQLGNKGITLRDAPAIEVTP